MDEGSPIRVINTTSASSDEDRDVSQFEFKVVTLNVAELLPSAEASPNWTPYRAMNHIAHHIAHDADVLCVQEWPNDGMKLDSKVWHVSSFVASHCGLCAVMLRKTSFSGFEDMECPSYLPCATVLAYTNNGFAIIISSVHNTPFSSGEAERLRNLSVLVESVVKPIGIPAIVAGDFNMRQKEDGSATNLLCLVDAFEASGKPKDKKFTFDTITNRYHHASREYHTRYDRIYFFDVRKANAQLCAKAGTFDMVAHKKITDGKSGNKFFLSDHFGLRQTFILSNRVTPVSDAKRFFARKNCNGEKDPKISSLTFSNSSSSSASISFKRRSSPTSSQQTKKKHLSKSLEEKEEEEEEIFVIDDSDSDEDNEEVNLE
eukprot:m.15232 g.15232  ORF g.15232 m.15232 type:complete len:374 (+) comp4441_c0_seq1:119-1240(+)